MVVRLVLAILEAKHLEMIQVVTLQGCRMITVVTTLHAKCWKLTLAEDGERITAHAIQIETPARGCLVLNMGLASRTRILL